MSRTMSRRSRSRSRTPPVRAKPKKVVNMLDSTALSEAKEVRRKPFHERVTGGPPRGPRVEAPEGAPRGQRIEAPRGPRIEAPDSGPRAQRVEAPEGGPERITCTIEGSGVRRSVFNRVSGGSFPSRGRFDAGGTRGFDGAHRSFDGGNQRGSGGFDGNRSFNDRRVNIAGDGGRRSFPERRSFGDRAVQRDDDDSFRRRQQEGEGEEKPVMKLVDPQEVPRSNRFFTHDDRGGGESEWRGRDMYDPRKDTGRYSDRPRFDRDRRDRDYGNNNRDFGGGRRDYGGGRGDYGNNRRFDRNDDRDSRRDSGAGAGGWDGFRQNGNGYSGSRFTPRNSGADGVWSHDKFLELETEDDEKLVEVKEGNDASNGGNDDEGVLVIDSTKTERTVE